MSLGQPYRTIGRDGLRGWKTLALFVVLVLSVGTFVLAAGEARAQQQDPAPEVYAAVTGPERTPVTEVRIARPEIEAPPADSSPLRSGERNAGPSPRLEPDSVMLGEPEPALALIEELDPAPGPALLPYPPTLESFEPVVESGLAPDPALVDPGPAPVPPAPVPLVDPPPAFSPVGFGLALADPGLVPGPAYGPSYGPEVTLADPGPAPGPRDPVWFVDPPPTPAPTGLGPALPYPRLAIEPVFGPVASGENKPPSSHVGEKLPVLSPAGSPQGVRTAPLPGNGPANAAPVEPSPSVADRKAPAPVPVVPKPPIPGSAVTDPPREASLLLSDLEAMASSAVETLQGAASVAAGAAVGVSEALATGDGDSTGPPPGGAERTSQEAPPPPPPPSPAPLGGSSFSLSGAGQIGPGGIVPLLMGILAAGLILLRPTGRLSWASCELPKPSSALLVPLERPG